MEDRGLANKAVKKVAVTLSESEFELLVEESRRQHLPAASVARSLILQAIDRLQAARSASGHSIGGVRKVA